MIMQRAYEHGRVCILHVIGHNICQCLPRFSSTASAVVIHCFTLLNFVSVIYIVGIFFILSEIQETHLVFTPLCVTEPNPFFSDPRRLSIGCTRDERVLACPESHLMLAPVTRNGLDCPIAMVYASLKRTYGIYTSDTDEYQTPRKRTRKDVDSPCPSDTTPSSCRGVLTSLNGVLY